MPILPLPQFEADLEADRKLYEKLKPPTSIVVRFGLLKLVGEFPYSGDAKPGCGSKLVIRTHRGTEIGEMLTSTCPNAGCSKSVTRKEMLEYIENSGGKDYPFFNQGRVLRIATVEDLNQQARLDADRARLVMDARRLAGEYNLPMKIVDAEPILGGERLTFFFTAEDRVDFREFVTQLASIHHTRIEMRQVGARDEARLVADYERCGQHCCCKQFLKVLKPVSMKSAKIQKATLDPLKISGRCGRLMCCLRYEDQTYDQLRKRLPKKKARVLTTGGWGYVIDTQILTQLVLVRLEESDGEIAVPVEEIQTGAAAANAHASRTEEEDLDADLADQDFNGGGAPEHHAPPRPDRPQRPNPPQGSSTQPRQERPRDRRPDRPRDERPPRPSGPAGDRGASGPTPQGGQQPRDSRPHDQPRPPGPPGPGAPGDGQRRRRRRRRRPGDGPGAPPPPP